MAPVLFDGSVQTGLTLYEPGAICGSRPAARINSSISLITSQFKTGKIL